MQTIRRLYFYTVAFISLETVLWGAIGLLRSFISGENIGGDVICLAQALSLLLVGVPVFVLHWWFAQRSVVKNLEERSNAIRAVFLYATLLATMLPITQNILAILDRSLAVAFDVNIERLMLGADQSLSDNLVAIMINGLAASYFVFILRADWRVPPIGRAYQVSRRFSRLIWVLYGAILSVLGLQQILFYSLRVWDDTSIRTQVLLPNGIALLVVGMSVFGVAWYAVQRALVSPDERFSLIRLVSLFLGVVFTATISLLTLTLSVGELFEFALGASSQLSHLLYELAGPFSVAVPFTIFWILTFRELRTARHLVKDATLAGDSRSSADGVDDLTSAGGLDDRLENTVQPLMLGMWRFYNYLLAFYGLVAIFVGLYFSLQTLINMLLQPNFRWEGSSRSDLAGALAALLVGIPLWLVNWRLVQRESSQPGERGEQSRRALFRRGYLFLVLFASVIGIMFSAGALLYQFILAWLGDPAVEMNALVVNHLKTVILFAVFGLYHWRILRSDNAWLERYLSKIHAQFPVLVLTPPDGEFGGVVAAALAQEAPNLPVAVHSFEEGAPDESFSAAKAVILPTELIVKPSEALRLWLRGYSGPRLAVPTQALGWHWISGHEAGLGSQARQAARTVRLLAEGERVVGFREISPWSIVIYILAGLFALEIVFVVITSLIEAFD